jgi:outer membrane protein TolC
MKMKILLLLGFVAFESTSAQDTLKLKLQEAMDSAMKNNKEIELARLDEKTAAALFNQTKAVFLPQVNLSYTAAVTNNPLNAFAFKLQQQSVSSSDFDPRFLNSPSTTQNYMTKVEWNQPLLNLDLVYQRRAADQQMDVRYYKTERTKEYVMFEVQKAYAQLQLAHQSVIVLKEALETVNSIFLSSKNYFEKGYLKKSDLLAAQVQVASTESKLAQARSNVCNASDYISVLMGTKSRYIYLAEPLEKVKETESFETLVPEDRADFKALNSALRAQATMINSAKMSRLPKLNAFAKYMFNDKTVFGFGSDSYLLGAQFTWTLFNGTASYHRTAEQKIAHARIEQQISYQKEQSQFELNKTFRQLTDNEFALQQYQASVGQAAEALRILQNRFEQGMASTDDLLRSQSTLSEQKLLLTETVFKYNTTLAYLHFLTSTSENNFE